MFRNKIGAPPYSGIVEERGLRKPSLQPSLSPFSSLSFSLYPFAPPLFLPPSPTLPLCFPLSLSLPTPSLSPPPLLVLSVHIRMARHGSILYHTIGLPTWVPVLALWTLDFSIHHCNILNLQVAHFNLFTKLIGMHLHYWTYNYLPRENDQQI